MPGMDQAHALVIGIAAYRNVATLPAAVINDARAVAALLTDPQACGYPAANVTTLLDAAATKPAIIAAFAKIAARATSTSTVFVFYSGHGARLERGSLAQQFLLPVEADTTSPSSTVDSAISGDELTAMFNTITAERMVIVFDACHAGGLSQPKGVDAPGFGDNLYEGLKQGRGRVIFASSKDTEKSWVKKGAANSLFTHHLVAGLRGGALGVGGVIRIFDLYNYLQPLVTAEQHNQHPVFKAEIEQNFPIALFRGGEIIKAVALTNAHTSDGYAYDVFVSYADKGPEKNWVQNKLLPKLRAEGIKAASNRDFKLGAPVIREIERLVLCSRYTLSILSPAYLESGFNDLENVLAHHLGTEERQRRMIAAMREPCTPHLSIRATGMLDLTNDEEWESESERLVYGLQQPNAA